VTIARHSLSRPSQTQSGTRRGMRPLIQAAISTAPQDVYQ